jgi:hypothetical protein
MEDDLIALGSTLEDVVICRCVDIGRNLLDGSPVHRLEVLP